MKIRRVSAFCALVIGIFSVIGTLAPGIPSAFSQLCTLPSEQPEEKVEVLPLGIKRLTAFIPDETSFPMPSSDAAEERRPAPLEISVKEGVMVVEAPRLVANFRRLTGIQPIPCHFMLAIDNETARLVGIQVKGRTEGLLHPGQLVMEGQAEPADAHAAVEFEVLMTVNVDDDNHAKGNILLRVRGATYSTSYGDNNRGWPDPLKPGQALQPTWPKPGFDPFHHEVGWLGLTLRPAHVTETTEWEAVEGELPKEAMVSLAAVAKQQLSQRTSITIARGKFLPVIDR